MSLVHMWLKELKDELKDILNKDFIHPSTFPWGAPMLFVKRRRDHYGYVLIIDS